MNISLLGCRLIALLTNIVYFQGIYISVASEVDSVESYFKFALSTDRILVFI